MLGILLVLGLAYQAVVLGVSRKPANYPYTLRREANKVQLP